MSHKKNTFICYEKHNKKQEKINKKGKCHYNKTIKLNKTPYATIIISYPIKRLI